MLTKSESITIPIGRLTLEGVVTLVEGPGPVVVVCQPHPLYGGDMNSHVVKAVCLTLYEKGIASLRFNFRGVGRSRGVYDNGTGELSDAASALDWMQTQNPNASTCWVPGFSFVSWIGMQLLMRRAEISGFVSAAPPANNYDFTFLAPCPASGIIIHGTADDLVPEADVAKLADRLTNQKNITIDYETIEGANHLFENYIDDLKLLVNNYLDKRMKPAL